MPAVSKVSIHHINLVVPDLDLAVERFEKIIGALAMAEEALPDRHVAIRRFDMGGTWLVLVMPTSDASPAAHWMRRHGPGLFLLSFGVDDLDNALANLADEDIDLQGEPRKGLDGWRVQDFDPASIFGIPLQLTQETGKQGEEQQ
ncbi:MAG: VOC family protein [Woeseiaceae bacterium]